MNIIAWIEDNLDFRTMMYQCYLNINGRTEDVAISLDRSGFANKLKIERQNGLPTLEVFLSDVDYMSPSLYYYTQDNGICATLVIPGQPSTEDDYDEYED